MAIIDKEKLKKLMAELENAKKHPEGADVIPLIQADIDALKSKAKESIKAQIKEQAPAGVPAYAVGGNIQRQTQNAAESAVEGTAERQQTINELMATEEGRIALANAEAKGGLDAFIRGLQRGSQVIGKGVGLDIQQMDPTYIKAMEVAHPAAFGGGKLGYEVGALAPVAAGTAVVSGPAIAAGGLPAAGGIALEALGGGLQANILARGENQSGTEVVGQTGLGAAIGGAVSGIPYIGKPVGAWLAKKFGLATKQVVDEAGSLTPEFVDYAKKQGLNEQDIINEAQSGAESIKAMGPMLPKSAAEANALPQSNLDSMADLINPRADVLERYAQLGFNPDDVPLAVSSGNKVIQEMGAILNQVRGAGLGSERDKLMNAANKVNEYTQQIISDFGGKISVADFSAETINGMKLTRENLRQQEKEAFDLAKKKIDEVMLDEGNTGLRNVRLRAPELVAEINRKKALRSVTDLPKEDQMVYKLFASGKNPTFDDVKSVRDTLGDIAFDNNAAFGTSERARAAKYYNDLRDLENKFAATVLGEGELEAAKLFTVNRKKIEGYLNFFGIEKDASADLGASLGAAASDIKGDKFRQLEMVFDNLPEEYRKGAMATMLGKMVDPRPLPADDFIPGLRSRAGGFAKEWENISRSDHLSAFVKKQIGEDGYKVFDMAGKFYSDLSRASSVPATGQIQTALMAMTPEKVTHKLLNSFAAKLRRVPAPTAKLGANVAEAAADVSRISSKEELTRVVDSFTHLTRSPKFKEAVLRAANDPASAEARQKSAQFMNTKIAQQYLKTVDPKIAQAVIAAGGLPRYLVAQDKEEVKQ
jgi:hypothetical protein